MPDSRMSARRRATRSVAAATAIAVAGLGLTAVPALADVAEPEVVEAVDAEELDGEEPTSDEPEAAAAVDAEGGLEDGEAAADEATAPMEQTDAPEPVDAEVAEADVDDVEVAAVDAVVNEVSYAGPDDTDFVEIAAEPGTDVSGWTVGSITRGSAPQSAAHVVTLADGTEIGENGVLAVDVPITNATTGGYGSSPFVVTDDGEIVGFWTIGARDGGVGSTAGSSALLPEAIRGETATAMNAISESNESLQLIGGDWVSAPATKGEPNALPQPPVAPEPGEITPIAEIQGEGSTTPFAGETVTTTGVVTAVYPTGGFDGYYIQTAGTGGDVDPSARTASDAIFVYSPSTVDDVEIGDFVQVVGTAGEYFTLTQITVAAGGLEFLDEVFAPVLPIEDFALTGTDADREPFEGMLVLPADDSYVVSDTYSLGGFGTTAFGSIGLGLDGPLVQETELGLPGTAAFDDAAADNAARAVTLDDGQSNRTATGDDVPYLTGNPDIRTGASLSFSEPVIVDYRFQWNFQPTSPVTGESDLIAVTGGNTRAANAAPQDVGGDVSVAAFNVLNYFTTLGVDVAGCQSFDDRNGVPLTVSGGCAPRGAWDETSLERQEGKIVTAINGLGADVVGLQEIESSSATVAGTDRDEAVATLVDALNAEAGAGTWDFAPSPEAVPANEDVIRTAFIFRTDAVTLDGASTILLDSPAYGNAREPLAQAFSPVAEPDYSFLVVNNHFKSKGGCSPSPAEGCFDADRVAQANALTAFADDVATDAGIEDVFLLGDFNSYSAENPVVAIEDAGYVNLNTDEPTYVFGGKTGSLDHVFVNESAADRITGTDVWRINGDESVLAEYSRFNYFASEHFEAGTPFRASDHSPIVVGLDVPDAGPTPGEVLIDVLSINDFHGRIEADGQSAGAAVLACAVDSYRAENENTLFVSAGDNIGASTFTSAVAQDQPTIDVLNAMGLDVSAFGNHEFDYGQDDVNDRVLPAVDFPYLAANIYDADGERAYDAFHLEELDGVTVGFIGAITEELPTLVSPAGIEGLEIGSMTDAVNEVAADLTDGDAGNGEADVLIVLVHDGAATPDLSAADGTPYGDLLADVDDAVVAIISGHTHQAYVEEVGGAWVTQSAQYGEQLGHLQLTVDTATGAVTATAENVDLVSADGAPICEGDTAIQGIVDDAVAEAEVLGAVPVGEITADFLRAAQSSGSENRGGESTIGNLVADVQLAATQDAGAQIAVMNPGGIRQDLLFEASGDEGDGVVTYREAAVVQPFANTLVAMDLTGQQVFDLLEQQWQPAGASRPFLKLGVSEGFAYVYDPSAAAGERIVSATLDGEPIEAGTTYRVVANSFLASGGDAFTVLADGTNRADTGRVDLDATVSYFQAQDEPVAPDYAQRAIGATWVSDPGATYAAGDEVAFDLSSLAFSRSEPKPEGVDVTIDGQDAGTFDVDTTIVDTTDEVGRAEVRATVPEGVTGDVELAVSDEVNGTTFTTTITVADDVPTPGEVLIDVLSINDFHGRVEANRQSAGAAVLACAVDSFRAENENTLFVSAGDSIGASTFVSAVAQDQPTLDVLNAMELDVSTLGNHEFDQGRDDVDDRVVPASDFPYVSANIYDRASGERAYDPYWLSEHDGVTVGFIGAMTEDLPNLVSPAGIESLEVRSMVDEVNAVAADLTDGDADNGEADVLVVLVHDGAPSPDLASAAGSPFGDLMAGVDENVVAIISAHTHQTYVEDVGGTWVTQAAQYGELLGHLQITVDTESGDVTATAENVDLVAADGTAYCEGDPDVQAIVDAAVEDAAELGSVPVGYLTADALRAANSDGSENRAGESTIGNLVADAQLWATQDLGADIAFMNAGGIREDLRFAADGDEGDGVVTYEEAANVQPFANTLVVVELTGDQVVELLELQWPEEGTPSRLGTSEGFSYVYDPTAEIGERVVSATLDGEPLLADETYDVTVNSFMAGGGDGYQVLTEGAQSDSGQVDLQAFVSYLQEVSEEDAPLEPPYDQRAIGAAWVSDPDAVYAPGDEVAFDLSSLAFTRDEPKPGEVLVTVGDGDEAAFEVDTTIVDNTDETGRAQVRTVVPEGADGVTEIVVVDDLGLTELTTFVLVDGGDGSGGPGGPGTPPPGGGAPTPVPDDELTDANRGDVTIPEVIVRGQLATAFIGTPGAEVNLFLQSDPFFMGTYTVAADGTVTFLVPTDAPLGEHRFVVTDADGDLVGWADTRVVDPAAGGGSGGADSGSGSLPGTGADVLQAVMLAVLLLWLGTAAVWLRHRRRGEL